MNVHVLDIPHATRIQGNFSRMIHNTQGNKQERQEYVDAITRWVEERRREDALSRDEIGRLVAGDRLSTLWRSQIEAASRYFRTNPREDATMGVLIVIYALADNDEGYADMSQERIGRVFGRSRKHINDCVSKLQACGLIQVEIVAGRPSRISPVVASAMVGGAQISWLFDAIAPHVERAKTGPKTKLPVTDAVTPNSELPVTTVVTGNGLPVTTAVTPNSNYLSPKTELPVTTAVTQFSYESPVVEEGPHEAREVEKKTNQKASEAEGLGREVGRRQEPPASLVPGEPQVTEDQFNRWLAVVEGWGLPVGQRPLFPANRDTARGLLLSIAVCAARENPADLVETALELALADAEAVKHGGKTEKSHSGLAAAKRYLEKTLFGKIGELEGARARRKASAAALETQARIAAQGEQRVQELKLAALSDAINRNAAARNAPAPIVGRRYLPGDNGELRFHPDAKLPSIPYVPITGVEGNLILERTPGATVENVEAALIEAGSVLASRKAVSVKDVIDFCVGNVASSRAKTNSSDEIFKGFPRNRVMEILVSFYKDASHFWSNGLEQRLGIAPEKPGCEIPADWIAAAKSIANVT